MKRAACWLLLIAVLCAAFPAYGQQQDFWQDAYFHDDVFLLDDTNTPLRHRINAITGSGAGWLQNGETTVTGLTNVVTFPVGYPSTNYTPVLQPFSNITQLINAEVVFLETNYFLYVVRGAATLLSEPYMFRWGTMLGDTNPPLTLADLENNINIVSNMVDGLSNASVLAVVNVGSSGDTGQVTRAGGTVSITFPVGGGGGGGGITPGWTNNIESISNTADSAQADANGLSNAAVLSVLNVGTSGATGQVTRSSGTVSITFPVGGGGGITPGWTNNIDYISNKVDNVSNDLVIATNAHEGLTNEMTSVTNAFEGLSNAAVLVVLNVGSSGDTGQVTRSSGTVSITFPAGGGVTPGWTNNLTYVSNKVNNVSNDLVTATNAHEGLSNAAVLVVLNVGTSGSTGQVTRAGGTVSVTFPDPIGGSQSPWVADVDADENGLDDADYIEFATNAAPVQPAANKWKVSGTDAALYFVIGSYTGALPRR